MTMLQIKRQALNLAADERIRLVQDIWDSVTRETKSVRISKAHKQLIDRRVAEHDENPASAISLAQAKSRIRKYQSRKLDSK